jgi:ElaB/YqjD/DUF883 family membrane-anchored ribosome-binding protein
MEIVLLVAILAVAGSALFVAFTFKNHIGLLVRKADLDPLTTKAASDISGQVTATGDSLHKQLEAAAEHQDEQVSALRGELNSKLEKLDRQVWKLGTSLARQRELIAGLENHVRGQEAQGVDPQEMDALESAMLHAEAYVARGGWNQPPRLFSLARGPSLAAEDPELASSIKDAPPGMLIPVLQEDLPAGEPSDVLAGIRWSEEVVGCVLVTEIVTLPPEAGKELPEDPAEAEEWAKRRSDMKAARLAVGVTRTGGHICGLRREGDDDIQVGDDLADDLVAALLDTF